MRKGEEVMFEKILTDSTIDDLIACEKQFLKAPPKKPRQLNRNIDWRFSVFSVKGEGEFKIFVAQSARMPEDFSIGLMFDQYLLYRVNGFHGTTIRGFHSAPHHAYPHAHKLTVDDISSGRGRKPSFIEDLRGEYTDLLSALLYFFDKCGIINYRKYFSNGEQLTFRLEGNE